MTPGCAICGNDDPHVEESRYCKQQQADRKDRALRRIASVLRVELDDRKLDFEQLEQLADAAEELLTDAIIRDRL